jgi:drug/metabolite transporter (DMT)-like permease
MWKIDTQNKWLHWALLVLLALIWGSSFILIKRGLLVYSAGEVGALRIGFAALVLIPLSFKKFFGKTPRQYLLLLLSGLMGSFFPAFLFATAQTQLNSSITGVLNSLTPFFVLILGALIFRQMIILRQAIGIGVGFLGTSLLILLGSEGHVGNINYYALFVVLATFLYASNLNLIKYHIADIKAFDITSVSLILVAPLAFVYLFGFTDFLQKVVESPQSLYSLGAIGILGVVGTAIALIIFNNLVKMTSPVFTSSVTYLIPIVAVVWGIFDGESLRMGHFIGICGIIAGVFIANRKRASS